MAASLSRSSTNSRRDGLYPLRFSRDLYQVAELIEIGFQGRLDAQGRASIREMKALSRFGPLLWVITFLNWLGLGQETGFVWRDQGRVVGNVSLYRSGQHPFLGRGWMIANVTTHPDYRRQGIALQLMEAAIGKIEQSNGRWAALQVEANNLGAIKLYEQLGFTRFECLDQWTNSGLRAPPFSGVNLSDYVIRLRRSDEIQKEIDLIFKRARAGGMAWTMPLDRSNLNDLPFQALGGLPDGRQTERWVLESRHNPEHFLAAMWVEASGLRRAKITLFPDTYQLEGGILRGFLASILERPTMEGRSIRLETTAGVDPVDRLLRANGFRRTRTLYQMRRML